MKRDLRTVTDAYVRLCLFHRTPPHVNELALHVSLTPSTLSKRFYALYGELPSTYIKRHQLAVAKRLLETTSLRMAAIAERAGFGTRETFLRVFRRMVLCTPRQYRMENIVTSGERVDVGRVRSPNRSAWMAPSTEMAPSTIEHLAERRRTRGTKQREHRKGLSNQ